MSGFSPLPQASSPALGSTADRVLTARQLEDLERANIQRALACCGGKVAGEAGAARLLGIPPTTLSSRMKVLNLRRPNP